MKSKIQRKLTTERGLVELFFSLRALMLIASFGAILGALLMFWSGGIHLYHAYETLIGVSFGTQTPAGGAASAVKVGGDEAQVVVYVLEAVDAFLFALVLMIFAYGIALGFVFHHVPERYRDYLPAWMLVEGVGQLKRTLAEVVIVVLIVIFARTIIESRGNLQFSMLVLPVSVLLLALALRLLHHPDEGGGHGERKPAKTFADDRAAENGRETASAVTLADAGPIGETETPPPAAPRTRTARAKPGAKR